MIHFQSPDGQLYPPWSLNRLLTPLWFDCFYILHIVKKNNKLKELKWPGQVECFSKILQLGDACVISRVYNSDHALWHSLWSFYTFQKADRSPPR